MKKEKDRMIRVLSRKDVSRKAIAILDKENLLDEEGLKDVSEEELRSMGISSLGDRMRILSLSESSDVTKDDNHNLILKIALVLLIAVFLILNAMFLHGFLQARADEKAGLSFIECKFNEKRLNTISSIGYEYYYGNFSGMGRYGRTPEINPD